MTPADPETPARRTHRTGAAMELRQKIAMSGGAWIGFDDDIADVEAEAAASALRGLRAEVLEAIQKADAEKRIEPAYPVLALIDAELARLPGRRNDG